MEARDDKVRDRGKIPLSNMLTLVAENLETVLLLASGHAHEHGLCSRRQVLLGEDLL